MPAGVAAQLEGLNTDGAEPYPLGRAVGALKPVDLRARLRSLLAPGHGGVRALVPLDAASPFRYWQAARTGCVPADATQAPIALLRRRVEPCVHCETDKSDRDQTIVCVPWPEHMQLGYIEAGVSEVGTEWVRAA